MKTVYLDHAATTKMLPEVIEAMMKSMKMILEIHLQLTELGKNLELLLKKQEKLLRKFWMLIRKR